MSAMCPRCGYTGYGTHFCMVAPATPAAWPAPRIIGPGLVLPPDPKGAEIAALRAERDALKGEVGVLGKRLEVARASAERYALSESAAVARQIAADSEAQSNEQRALAAEAEVERLESERGILAMSRSMLVARLGGTVEGRPTHQGNYLQRVDELRASEAALESLRGEVREVLTKVEWTEKSYGPVCPSCEHEQPDHAPGCRLAALLKRVGP